MAAKKSKSRAVLVTTEHRGVFFGYVTDESKAPERIELRDMRNCIYWSSAERGVFGLAATGPGRSCKIGPKVPKFTAWKITSVTDCTPEAVEKWEAATWS